MISKRLIMTKPFNMDGYSNEQILNMYDPEDKKVEKVFHAIESGNDHCIVTRKIQKVNGLIIESMETDKSDILGTNIYITSSLVSYAAPKLAKTIYVDSKLMLFIYPDDEVVKTALEELERIALFLVGGILKSGGSSEWKLMLKMYADSNIRYIEPGKENERITEGERYIYISKDDLFCDPKSLKDSENDED